MLAAQINNYGGKDVVEVVDATKPKISPDQVLVEVKAAAINPFDITVREGGARQMAELNFPATLGGDFAGTIVEIGSNVKGFEIGQKVFGQAGALSGNGSFAEFAPLIFKQVQRAPKNVDFIQAAALPLTSVSAYQAMVDTIELKSNQKILIHGGGGGIGSIAIQIAKDIGAYIATTASNNDAEYVKSLGAHETIDYKTQDFSKILKDYDAVFDTVGGETTTDSIKVLKNGGMLVSMASDADEELIQQKNIKFTHQFTQLTQDRLQKIVELVEAGKLKANIDKVFDLKDAAEALEYQKTGHPRGKVVIRVSE